jgi:hypothetical protein
VVRETPAAAATSLIPTRLLIVELLSQNVFVPSEVTLHKRFCPCQEKSLVMDV